MATHVMPTWRRIQQEQEWESLPPGTSAVTQIRYAVLHGEKLTADEVTERWGTSSTTLSMIMADMRRAGFVVAEERIPTAQGAKKKRLWIANLEHKAHEFTSQQRRASRSKPKGKAVAVIEAAVAKNGNASRDKDRADLRMLREFHHLAAPTPPVGTVVRVVMVAEQNGSTGAVLADMGGRQWFVHFDVDDTVKG
jgi:hypothetical protein